MDLVRRLLLRFFRFRKLRNQHVDRVRRHSIKVLSDRVTEDAGPGAERASSRLHTRNASAGKGITFAFYHLPDGGGAGQSETGKSLSLMRT